LLALSGLFHQSYYWLAFSIVVLTSAAIGAKYGVGRVANYAGKLMYLFFGGGKCKFCGTPYGKESVQCAQCGKLINETSSSNHT
ncbi:hypothetical protein, partial [Amphritea sp.]|uniref:hypothetical protein n=1 Tax=Amphritea sp. TaxID=1872502 RepID=UPI003D0B096C